jgi:hypothetical protein
VHDEWKKPVYDGPRRVGHAYPEVVPMDPLDFVSYGGPVFTAVAPVYAKVGPVLLQFI